MRVHTLTNLPRSTAAFTGWGSFCKLGINATLMLIAEWWSFAIVVLLSGTLPDPEVSVAVMGIGNSLEELLYVRQHHGKTHTHVLRVCCTLVDRRCHS